jgi:hypothetical protein
MCWCCWALIGVLTLWVLGAVFVILMVRNAPLEDEEEDDPPSKQ